MFPDHSEDCDPTCLALETIDLWFVIIFLIPPVYTQQCFSNSLNRYYMVFQTEGVFHTSAPV